MGLAVPVAVHNTPRVCRSSFVQEGREGDDRQSLGCTHRSANSLLHQMYARGCTGNDVSES